MRLRAGSPFRSALLLCLGAALAGCASEESPPGVDAPAAGPETQTERLQYLLGTLAHDSMEGRYTGSRGLEMAADFLVAEMESYGVEPGNGDSWFQPVTLLRADGGPRDFALPGGGVDPDTFPADRVVVTPNVVGLVRGTDPERADEYVIVGAHYDAVGIVDPIDGDSIVNGADDDGSGVVAALEVARALAAEPAARPVFFLFGTAEEQGLLGARYYIQEPIVPLDSTVAGFFIEMIGRPDSLAGGAGRTWLTGYDRSTVGSYLESQGIPIVPDPRPQFQFFRRSDNYPFALQGIPAHTLSTFAGGGHYHRPDDEVELVDWAHMTTVVGVIVDAVRAVADGPRPEWVEGGRPTAPGASPGTGGG